MYPQCFLICFLWCIYKCLSNLFFNKKHAKIVLWKLDGSDQIGPRLPIRLVELLDQRCMTRLPIRVDELLDQRCMMETPNWIKWVIGLEMHLNRFALLWTGWFWQKSLIWWDLKNRYGFNMFIKKKCKTTLLSWNVAVCLWMLVSFSVFTFPSLSSHAWPRQNRHRTISSTNKPRDEVFWISSVHETCLIILLASESRLPHLTLLLPFCVLCVLSSAWLMFILTFCFLLWLGSSRARISS